MPLLQLFVKRPNTFGRGNEPIGNSGISNGGDRWAPELLIKIQLRKINQSNGTFRTYRDFDNGSTGATLHLQDQTMVSDPVSNYWSWKVSIRYQSSDKRYEDTYSSPRNFSPRFEATTTKISISSETIKSEIWGLRTHLSHQDGINNSQHQRFFTKTPAFTFENFNGGSNFGAGGGRRP